MTPGCRSAVRGRNNHNTKSCVFTNNGVSGRFMAHPTQGRSPCASERTENRSQRTEGRETETESQRNNWEGIHSATTRNPVRLLVLSGLMRPREPNRP